MQIGMRLVFLCIALALVSADGSADLNVFQHYIGTSCNLLTGAYCNTAQTVLALSNHQAVMPAYIPGLAVVQLDSSQIEEISEDTFTDHAFVEMVHTMDQVSTNSAESFGIGVDIPFARFAFSASESYSNCVQTMYRENGEQILASSTVSKATATITIKPGEETRLKLDTTLARDLRALPTALPEGNKTALMQFLHFFEKYGTHYVTQVTIGGLLQQAVQINKKEAESRQMSETDLSTAVGYILDTHVGHTQSGASVKDISSFSSQSSVVALGGSASLLNNVYEWADSVHNSPQVIDSKLESISTAVRPYFPEVAAAIEQAIETLMSPCKTPDNKVCSGGGWCNFSDSDSEQVTVCECSPSKHGNGCQYTNCEAVTCGSDLYCDELTGACCKLGWHGANCEKKCGIWHIDYPTYNGSYIQYDIVEHGMCACDKLYSPEYPFVTFDADNSDQEGSFFDSPISLCDGIVCGDWRCYYFSTLACNLGECLYASRPEMNRPVIHAIKVNSEP